MYTIYSFSAAVSIDRSREFGSREFKKVSKLAHDKTPSNTYRKLGPPLSPEKDKSKIVFIKPSCQVNVDILKIVNKLR